MQKSIIEELIFLLAIIQVVQNVYILFVFNDNDDDTDTSL